MIITLTKEKKQALLLYITSAASVIVGFFSSVINTRFLDPIEYGNVRYVQNIVGFISSLLLFGYFLSGSRLLALSTSEERSRKIRGALVLVLLAASIVLLTVTAICIPIHNEKPDVSILIAYCLPVCFSPLLLNYVNCVAQGDNHIVRLSLARLLPALIYVLIAYFVYSQTGASAKKMILLQWGLSTVILISIILSEKPSFRDLKPIFKELNLENKSYGFQLYLGSLVMVSTGYIAGVTLGVFNLDNSLVGFYTLAITVCSPLMLLPTIIGTTYFKQFAHMDRIPDKLMMFTIILTLVTCVIFVIIIKWLVVWLYTDRYSMVGVYASIIAIGSCVHGFGDMINRYLGSHGQGKSIRNASIANGVFRLIGSFVLVYFFNIWGAIATNIFCDFLYCICLVYYYRKYVSNVHL